MTIWTRWPVSTSILPIRSRIRAGIGVAGGLRLAGQRLGQQADRRQRRAQLVRQVVDELGADLLEPAQLRDVLQDDPQAAVGCAPGAQHELRPVGPGDRDLAGRRAGLERRLGDRLDLGVEEGLDQRPPEERPGGWSSSVWAAVLAPTIRDPSPT